MRKKFFIKDYAGRYYCFSTSFVLRRFFGFWWVKDIGFDVTIFDDRSMANDYIRLKRIDYINAKKFVR